MDADLARQQPVVARRQHEHTGTVADGALAHPDGPARLTDAVAGHDGRLDLATTGIQIEDALVDLQRVGHHGQPPHHFGETGVDLALVAHAQQPALDAGLQGLLDLLALQAFQFDAIAAVSGIVGATADPGLAVLQLRLRPRPIGTAAWRRHRRRWCIGRIDGDHVLAITGRRPRRLVGGGHVARILQLAAARQGQAQQGQPAESDGHRATGFHGNEAPVYPSPARIQRAPLNPL